MGPSKPLQTTLPRVWGLPSLFKQPLLTVWGLPSLFKQPLPRVWGLVREVARDGECATWMDGMVRGQIGQDGTRMEGAGWHVDGGDGMARGRTERDAQTNLSKQHPPWV